MEEEDHIHSTQLSSLIAAFAAAAIGSPFFSLFFSLCFALYSLSAQSLVLSPGIYLQARMVPPALTLL